MIAAGVDQSDLTTFFIKTDIKKPTVVVKRNYNESAPYAVMEEDFMQKTFPNVDCLSSDYIFVVFDDEDEAVEFCDSMPKEYVYAVMYSSSGEVLTES